MGCFFGEVCGLSRYHTTNTEDRGRYCGIALDNELRTGLLNIIQHGARLTLSFEKVEHGESLSILISIIVSVRSRYYPSQNHRCLPMQTQGNLHPEALRLSFAALAQF